MQITIHLLLDMGFANSVCDFSLREVDASAVELAPKASAVGPDESTEAAATVLPPVITEVYLVTTNTLPVFKPAGHS